MTTWSKRCGRLSTAVKNKEKTPSEDWAKALGRTWDPTGKECLKRLSTSRGNTTDDCNERWFQKAESTLLDVRIENPQSTFVARKAHGLKANSWRSFGRNKP
ncbi:hypothetical protein G6F40_015850 [Rhizopus arrhizus]|nr:hypothetical protein G6F40_015850 [Rhizopus arrhizus]